MYVLAFTLEIMAGLFIGLVNVITFIASEVFQSIFLY